MAKKKEGKEDIKTRKRNTSIKKNSEMETKPTDDIILSTKDAEYFAKITPEKTEDEGRKTEEELPLKDEGTIVNNEKEEDLSKEKTADDKKSEAENNPLGSIKEKVKNKKNNIDMFVNTWNGVEMDLY